ncbi:hypothetical protein [Paenibacillus methanolicus]|uniref:Uncharacterized protein n=1 Tax=Paenibacillus methanolicus TaxID=582686 RepID=A0A5S5C608_9BACL|nr:hypothetical protein [Paenibacillus methanolicus]TYP74871.1 hypothetical protein BCM02_105418 [Paenibacillus methanolicus]
MSEFSESYHLFAAEQADGMKLLRRGFTPGYVFPAGNNWVTILPKGAAFRPNRRLIAANKGTLVHLIHAEDHGWSFSVYDGNKRACHYACTWEEEIEIDQDGYDRGRVVELINANPRRPRTVKPLDITRILYVSDFDDIADRDPVGQLAELLALENYAWLSYDYMHRETRDNPALLEAQGIKRARGLLGLW